MNITLSEGIGWMKTLKERHAELLVLRNQNSQRSRRFFGANADKETVEEPLYDVKALDKLLTRVAKEIRLLDEAIKRTNAATVVAAYEKDDSVLGELS